MVGLVVCQVMPSFCALRVKPSGFLLCRVVGLLLGSCQRVQDFRVIVGREQPSVQST